MEFSLDRFYQINRRILIWLGLFGLIWMLRPFIDIVFIVFVLCYLTMPLSRFIQRYSRVPHYIATTLVFLGLILVGAGVFNYVTPRIVTEAEVVMKNAGMLDRSAQEFQAKVYAKYPLLADMGADYLLGRTPVEVKAKYYKEEEFASIPNEQALKLYLEGVFKDFAVLVPQFMALFGKIVGNLLISVLFAYLISLDTARLRREVDSLRYSRLKHFHEQTAGPVVKFANVLGRALQAQFFIACLNTLLTAIGMLFLGLPAVTALAVVVFLCSFIPVLGVFISTAPMMVVALGSGDFMQAVWVVVLVTAIHTVEAYVLNPLIYGRALHLNPVMVLIILYVGHHAFGVWGMVLGVPVVHYVIHDVLKIRPEELSENGGEAAADA